MRNNKALLACMEVNSGLKRVIDDFCIVIEDHNFVRDPDPESDIFTCRDCFLTVWYEKPEEGKEG